MVLTDDFYTNLFALAGASGVTMDVDLLDPNGVLLDTQQVVLTAYAPWFSSVENLWDVASFENGTALVQVNAGSMVMLGSKVDRLSKDPTTVEQAFGAGGGSADGTYQFAVYDDLGFASGGNLEIVDAVVDVINGTYVNYDKVDGGGIPECPVIFQWGFDLAPTSVEDFASGVEYDEVYPPGDDFDGGTITYTITFTVDDNLGFSGTLDAVGSEFRFGLQRHLPADGTVRRQKQLIFEKFKTAGRPEGRPAFFGPHRLPQSRVPTAPGQRVGYRMNFSIATAIPIAIAIINPPIEASCR